jgi:hypothetical protein
MTRQAATALASCEAVPEAYETALREKEPETG